MSGINKVIKLMRNFKKWTSSVAQDNWKYLPDGEYKIRIEKVDEEPDLSVRFHTNDGFTTAPFPLK